MDNDIHYQCKPSPSIAAPTLAVPKHFAPPTFDDLQAYAAESSYFPSFDAPQHDAAATFQGEFHVLEYDARPGTLYPLRHRDSIASSSGSSLSDPPSPAASFLPGSAPPPSEHDAEGDEGPWNLVAYHIPWGSAYEGYDAGTLPGPEGPCIFLRSPTPSKKQRTSQACEKCRERKAKCSGSRPSCARCESRGLPCVYSAVAVAAPEPPADSPRPRRARPKGLRKGSLPESESSGGPDDEPDPPLPAPAPPDAFCRPLYTDPQPAFGEYRFPPPPPPPHALDVKAAALAHPVPTTPSGGPLPHPAGDLVFATLDAGSRLIVTEPPIPGPDLVMEYSGALASAPTHAMASSPGSYSAGTFGDAFAQPACVAADGPFFASLVFPDAYSIREPYYFSG